MNRSQDGFTDANRSLDTFKEKVDAATERGSAGFDKVDQGAMGFRDTITGVQDTMTGFQALMGQGEAASETLGDKLLILGTGVGDLASGMVNLILPTVSAAAALNAESIASAKATVASIAHRAAAVAGAAATGLVTVAQWALNAAMDANPIGIVVVALAALAAGMIYAYNNSETFRHIVQAIGDVFTDILWPALKKVGEYLSDFFAPAFAAAAEAVSKAWGWLKRLVGAGDDATDSEKELKKATEQAEQAADDHAKALKKESDAARESANSALGLMDAENALAQAIQDASESVSENGKGLDVNTEKGRKNRQALQSIAEAANRMGQEVLDAGGSQLDAARRTDEGRQAFIRSARQMGMTAAQARNLANQVFAIPNSKVIRLATRGVNESMRDVAALRRELARLTGKTIYINEIRNTYGGTAPGGGVSRRAMGGVVGPGAASGGPRSGRIRVGEYGPEDIDLAPGSMVHTASDSLGGGGGSGALRVELEWVGSAAADDDFMAWLRRNIRIRGGVDLALGGA
jgi:methyl-accepting chemotaxis protein